jgi:hypothetical protein
MSRRRDAVAAVISKYDNTLALLRGLMTLGVQQ